METAVAVMHLLSTARPVREVIRYITDADKTDHGLLVSGCALSPASAAEQILRTRARYEKTDAKQLCHIIQSFSNADLRPEEAHLFAREFVLHNMPDHEAVIATHIDTGQIHNHIAVSPISKLTGQSHPEWTRLKKELKERFVLQCLRYGIPAEVPGNGRKSSYIEHIMKNEGFLALSEKLSLDAAICLGMALSLENFYDLMASYGYTADRSQSVPLFRMEGRKKGYPCKRNGTLLTEDAIGRIIEQGLSLDAPEPDFPVLTPYPVPGTCTDLQTLYEVYLREVRFTGKGGVSPFHRITFHDTIHVRRYEKHLSFLKRHGIKTPGELKRTCSDLSLRLKDLGKQAHRIENRLYRNKALFSALDERDRYAFLPMPEPELIRSDPRYRDAVEKLSGHDIGELRKLRQNLMAQLSAMREEKRAVKKELFQGRAIQKTALTVNEKLNDLYRDPEADPKRKEEWYGSGQRTARPDHARS